MHFTQQNAKLKVGRRAAKFWQFANKIRICKGSIKACRDGQVVWVNLPSFHKQLKLTAQTKAELNANDGQSGPAVKPVLNSHLLQKVCVQI